MRCFGNRAEPHTKPALDRRPWPEKFRLRRNAKACRSQKTTHTEHDYQPRDDIKYLGHTQYVYPRKNWSSVVLWNCAHPAHRALTPQFVNEADPVVLHRLTWLNDNEIGSLDVRWNWLVGEYVQPPVDVKNVHWTVGGPYFEEYVNADFADEWRAMHACMNHCEQTQKS